MALFNSLLTTKKVVTRCDVLNGPLYTAMAARFRAVRVVHRGEPMIASYKADNVLDRKRLHLDVFARGETYVTDCPFCGDSRQRLWVNHQFGVVDTTLDNYRHYELWKCYNTDCQEEYDRRLELADMLTMGYAQFADLLRLKFEEPRVQGLEPCEFPGETTPVDQLNPSHPAAAYLDGRKFDRTELTEVWGVSLATYVPPRTRGASAQGRIIVPVRANGQMVGWQARYAGDVDWRKQATAKYLTYFPKTLAVYGIDEAAAAPYIALMEGVTDVWRHGPGAVALLGKTISSFQARILAERLRGRPLVLVPDCDDPAAENAFFHSAGMILREQRHRSLAESAVGVVALPKGTDPGSEDRQILRANCEFVAQNAATKLVDL